MDQFDPTGKAWDFGTGKNSEGEVVSSAVQHEAVEFDHMLFIVLSTMGFFIGAMFLGTVYNFLNNYRILSSEEYLEMKWKEYCQQEDQKLQNLRKQQEKQQLNKESIAGMIRRKGLASLPTFVRSRMDSGNSNLFGCRSCSDELIHEHVEVVKRYHTCLIRQGKKYLVCRDDRGEVYYQPVNFKPDEKTFVRDQMHKQIFQPRSKSLVRRKSVSLDQHLGMKKSITGEFQAGEPMPVSVQSSRDADFVGATFGF